MIAVFSLGANLGDRLGFLQCGLDAVAESAVAVEVSPVYETAPVGGPAQGPYLNAVLRAELPADTDLGDLIGRAEGLAGRVRGRRWGPRTLDVDVVSVTGPHRVDPALTVPHPRARHRAFVLAPWLDLDPEANLPGAGRVAALLADVDRAGIRRRDDLRLVVG